MTKLLGLALAGGFGTLARYGMTVLAGKFCDPAGFPWPTFAVNALGCLGFGLILAITAAKASIGADLQFFILTGFFGAFTTFSTFQSDTVRLLHDSHYLAAAANIIGQNIIGIAMLCLGLRLGRLA